MTLIEIKGLEPLIEAIRRAGIVAGAWGYVYLKWKPVGEASAIFEAVKRYQPAFYLLDAEVHAKNEHKNAEVFSHSVKSLGINAPIGLNSY